MIAAIVRDGVVENIIAVEHLADVQSSPWPEALAGAQVVAVRWNQHAAPGYLYDPAGSPDFQPPPQTPEPDVLTPEEV